MPFDGNPEETVVSPTLQVLIGARNLLVRDGWIQGMMRSKNGRCISGAVGDAAAYLKWPQRFRTETDVRNVLRQLIMPQPSWLHRWFGLRHIWLESWNDAKGRTREDAIALFDKAIAVARERRT